MAVSALTSTAFSKPLLEAKGLKLGDGTSKGRGQWWAQLELTPQNPVFKRNLLVGKAYTALLDLKPGDDKFRRSSWQETEFPADSCCAVDDEDEAERAALLTG